jgi:hypothetical protein
MLQRAGAEAAGRAQAIEDVRRRIRAADWAELIPQYRFFVPRPDGREHALVARSRDAGTVGSWRVVTRAPPRRWWHAVFNPASKRAEVVEQLQRCLEHDLRDVAAGRSPASSVFPSRGYLGLLRWATTASEGGDALQFAVVVVRTDGPATLGMLSDWHAR